VGTGSVLLSRGRDWHAIAAGVPVHRLARRVDVAVLVEPLAELARAGIQAARVAVDLVLAESVDGRVLARRGGLSAAVAGHAGRYRLGVAHGSQEHTEPGRSPDSVLGGPGAAQRGDCLTGRDGAPARAR